MYRYVLKFTDYRSAIHALKRLRKRGAEIELCIVIVKVQHWNKVKDFLKSNQRIIVVVA